MSGMYISTCQHNWTAFRAAGHVVGKVALQRWDVVVSNLAIYIRAGARRQLHLALAPAICCSLLVLQLDCCIGHVAASACICSASNQ